ncbi:MAG: TolC family protein [Bacteroidia bacterium]
MSTHRPIAPWSSTPRIPCLEMEAFHPAARLDASARLCVATALICCFLSSSQAQSSQPLSLESAIAQALKARKEIEALDRRSQATAYDVSAVNRRYIPQISAGVDVKYNAILATSIVPIGALNPGNPTDEVAAVRFGTNWANGAGLSLTQVIYDPSIKGSRELARMGADLTEAQRAQQAEAITVAVAQAYYAVLVSEAEVGFAESDLALATTRLTAARQQLQQERALPVDVEAAKIDSLNARLRLMDVRRNAAEWRLQLAYQMGLDTDQGAEMQLKDRLEEVLGDNGNSFENTCETPAPGPEEALQQAKIAQTAQQALVEKSGYKPTLLLNGYLGANHFSDQFDPWDGDKWFPTSYIGLSLSVPLTEGFVRQQRIRSLETQQLAGQAELEALKAKRELDFERAWMAYGAAREALQVQDAAMQLAKKQAEVVEARASEDRATITDLESANRNYQSARFQYLRRAYDLLITELEMRRLCGVFRYR